MRARSSQHARCGRGFVLPITVIILALVSAGLVMMSHRSEEMRSLAQAAQEERDAAAIVQAATAEALYLSSVLHRRGDSLGTIRLDGRSYRSPSGAVVSYTDAGALLSLRRVRREELFGLLAATGVSDPVQAERLTDVLLDYLDGDDLVQLNGAESREYVALKLPPPRNERLLTPDELRRLIAWRDLPDEIWARFREHVHVGHHRTVNRHTVQGPVLAAIAGLEPSVAQELVRSRPPGTMLRIESLPTIAGGSYLAEGRYINVPSVGLLVKICPPGVAWCQHLSLTTTGESQHAPWHVNYAYRLPRVGALPDTDSVAFLPDQLPDKPPPPLYSPFDFNNSLP